MSCHSPEEEEDSGKVVVVELVVVVVVVVWMQESMELGSFTFSYCQPASCRCLDTSSHCGEIVAVKEGQEMRSCHNLHGYF